MTQYVLQYKPNVHKDKWLTMAPAYMTLEAAKAARSHMPMNQGIRIAEAYTVTRYKPVKEA